jgi:predicted nucleic acid-binding protein
LALTHLIDTSVLTRLGDPSVREVIESLTSVGQLSRAGISDLEIGYSARTAAEWDTFKQALEVFQLVETTSAHIQRARQVQRSLASESQRGRKIPDLLVAAAAEEHGYAVLHYDSDFDLIQSVTGQTCEWIVPRGTID